MKTRVFPESKSRLLFGWRIFRDLTGICDLASLEVIDLLFGKTEDRV